MSQDILNQKRNRKISKQLPDDDPLANMGYQEYMMPSGDALEVNIGVTVSRITPNEGVDYTAGMHTEGNEDSSSSSKSDN